VFHSKAVQSPSFYNRIRPERQVEADTLANVKVVSDKKEQNILGSRTTTTTATTTTTTP
jgi:hypothetical protein